MSNFSIVLVLSIVLLLGFVFYYFLKKRPQKFLAPESYEELIANTHFVTVDEVTFCYQRLGRGPHLLLLHGLGANLFTWRFVIGELSKFFTVTVLDLPGFGQSSKNPILDYDRDSQVKRLKQFLDHLKIGKCFVIGSSMGGAIGLGLALHFPEKVEKYIGLSPATNPRVLPFNPRPLLKALSQTYKIISRPFVRVLVGRVVYNKHLVTNESVDRYFQPYKQNKNAVVCVLKAAEVIADPSQPFVFKDVKAPCEILYGTNDVIVERRYIDQLMESLPNAQLFTQPAVGHHTMEDAPKWVVEHAISFFLKQA